MTTRRIARWSRLIPLVLVVAVLPAQAASLEARDGKIVEVTVYPDRAEVVREATLNVPAGASTVAFRAIPLAADPASLRVSAKGIPALLGAVDIRRHAEAPLDTAEQVALREEVARLQQELAKLSSRERVSADMREFLKSLRATTATRESENIGAGKSDPAAIGATYDLLARKLSELGDEDLARNQAKEKLDRELEVARAKLSMAPAGASIQSHVAEAEIEARSAGSLTMRLSYVVSGASWSAAYRATLDPASGEVGLVSEGVVRQQTGENWPAVALRLSTAAPARGVAPPEMATRLLQPIFKSAVGGVSGGFAEVREEDLSVAGRFYQNNADIAPGVRERQALSAPASEAAPVETRIVQSAYNVAFEVPGRSDVPSDGAAHRVVLRNEDLAGALTYRVAPAIEPAAFLTSIVRAPAQYPLLSGEMRVLAGGSYLGVYALPETAPGAELTVPFGRDNRIKIDRVQQPQDRTFEGLTGKTLQIAYATKTSVENLRDKEVTVILEDRVPISEDERIVVEVEKTTTADHSPSKSRPGVVLWKLTLAPHEKKDVVLAYSVRFPKEMNVAGLE